MGIPLFFHKKGPSNTITNYRPISIMSYISKLFESVIHSRLHSFFNAQNLLSERQYGFRKVRSTELSIFNLLSKILPAIEHKKYAICLFLDFASCFDTIDRAILCSKFDCYGVRNENLNLIKSYLYNRQQYVYYGVFQRLHDCKTKFYGSPSTVGEH